MHFHQWNRREFITLLGGAVTAWPLAARAQQPDRVRRIGVLMSVPENDPEGQAWLGAFSEGLQQLGWTAGRNIRLDYRWAAPFDAESRQQVAKELVALQPDLILAQNTVSTASVLQETRSIPIIFANVVDPIGSGFVASLARPGRSGYESSGFFGVGAPAKTSSEIVDKLNREINAGLADPKLKAQLADLGGMILPGSPADFRTLIAEEREKWAKVIRAANIKPD